MFGVSQNQSYNLQTTSSIAHSYPQLQCNFNHINCCNEAARKSQLGRKM